MAGVVVEDSSVTVFFYLGLALLFGWMLVIIVLVRQHWLEWVINCCCRWKRRPPSVSTALSRDGSLHERITRQNSATSAGRLRSASRTSRKSHRPLSEKQSTGQQSLGSRQSRKDMSEHEHAPDRPLSPAHALVCISLIPRIRRPYDAKSFRPHDLSHRIEAC
jgi:hypothetical protein